VDLFIKVEWTGTRLSITGVEGPRRNGDCYGSCGQISDSLKNMHSIADLWHPRDVEALREIWEGWHLNDMRPGCEHQRKLDLSKKVEIVTYRLTGEALQQKSDLRRHIETRCIEEGRCELSDDARALLNLPYTTKRAPDADSFASGFYEVEKREEKTVGWVTPDEHPEGMLARECMECGYRYGSSWLTEEVPEEVLEELFHMPDADTHPAWV
jgi:hypothetical protein